MLFRSWWRPAGAPGGAPCAGPRRPAGWSPRGRGDGRCRARRCRRPGGAQRGCPRSSGTACAAERAAAAEKLAALANAHERLTTEFKALSADALSRNTDEFLKLARESFARAMASDAGMSLARPLSMSLIRRSTSTAQASSISWSSRRLKGSWCSTRPSKLVAAL